jgi:hypothetical protein
VEEKASSRNRARHRVEGRPYLAIAGFITAKVAVDAKTKRRFLAALPTATTYFYRSKLASSDSIGDGIPT